MSTKTTIKRVALVAVSALGFGLMSVVPASAGDIAATAVTTYAPIARVDATADVVTKVTTATDAFDEDETVWLAGRFVSGGKPSGSALTNLSISFALTSSTTVDTPTNEANAGYSTSYAFESTADDQETAYVKAQFTPDVAGTYTLFIWNDHNHDGIYQGTEKGSTATVKTAGAPTRITLSNIGGASIMNGTSGALVKVTLTDAAAAATVLAPGELLALTENGSGAFADWDANAITELTSADFTRSGVAWMNVTSTAAETLTITVKGDGDLPATLSSTLSIIYRDEDVAGAGGVLNSDVTFDGTAGVDGWNGTEISLAAQTVTFVATIAAGDVFDTATQYTSVQVADLKGQVAGTSPEAETNGGNVASGAFTLAYDKAVGIAKTEDSATFTVAFAASAAASTNVVDINAGGADLDGIDRAAAVATAFDAGTTERLALTGGSVSLTGALYDQFGNTLASYPVTMTFAAGRNAGRVAISAITNADGEATLSYTDAAVTATSLTDTLDFASAGDDLTGDVTITYSAITSGTLTVDADATTQNAINTDSAKAATVTLTFTALDANSAPIVGLPITVAGASTGASVSTGYATIYTGADGKATASVFSSKTGTMSWTGTASLISKTATATRVFVNAASDAKVLAATATATAVTVTVTDNYGNVVKGVNVDFSRTGNVSFGGLASLTAKTNASGVAEVLFTGTGTVTASLAEADYPKSAWIAGYLGKTATATASTAAVAGVATKTVDVSGATPAGEAAAEAATEAAVEATDAANQAYEAAVVATETAEAAVAAAEDAKAAAEAATAAVEALATSVSTMMAKLESQVASLAKTVAKILKRV